jgi:hypothetical protein
MLNMFKQHRTENLKRNKDIGKEVEEKENRKKKKALTGGSDVVSD